MEKDSTQHNKRLTVPELADRWGLSTETIYKGLRNGTIPCLRIGRRFVIPFAAIERYEANAGQHESVSA